MNFKNLLIQRINNNQNVIMPLVGQTGSGKSTVAIAIGYITSQHFNVPFNEDNIATSLTELLEIVVEKKPPKGSVIILEEAGVLINAKSFMKTSNKLIVNLTQTFRHLNYIFILTVPSMSFIDKSVRMLVHYAIETSFIDYKNKINWCKVSECVNNFKEGEYYFRSLSSKSWLFSTYQPYVGFELPPQEVLYPIEQKISKFKVNSTKEWLKEMKEMEKVKSKKSSK